MAVVIAVAEGLADNDLTTAIEACPPHVLADLDYPGLLEQAGLEDITVSDVTSEFLATASTWLREWDADADDITSVVGGSVFAEQQDSRRRAVDAIERGLLHRFVFTARRP